MDNAKLKKYVTAALVASGVAVTLPAFASLLVPVILPLTAGILSDENVRKLGKDGVNYIVSVLGNLVASALQQSPNLWKKSDENHDLLKLLATAYSKAIEELLKEIENNPEYETYQYLGKLTLPEIKKHINDTLSKQPSDWEKLFPSKENLETQKDEEKEPEKVPFYLKLFGYSPKAKVPISEELANKLKSEDFILSIAENSQASKEILVHEVEISLRRWFAETTPLADEFPKSLTPFVFERLAEIIPKYVGTLIKEEGFEKSWIAFQRSHLQAILKEVKNNKNGLSDEDRELLRPLAELLDRFSKLEGVPEKLADLSENCLKRFDNIETILENNQAELLKAIDEGEKRLAEKIEALQKQVTELNSEILTRNNLLDQINTNIKLQGKSTNEITSEIEAGKNLIEQLRVKADENGASIQRLLAEFGDNGTFANVVLTLKTLSNDNIDLSQQIEESNSKLEEKITSGFYEVLSELGKTQAEITKLREEIRKIFHKPKFPTSLPFIENFTGRKDELGELDTAYKSGSRRFVLWGIGGSGKTAMTVQFAEDIFKEHKYLACLFVDMRGFSREEPLSAQNAMLQIIWQFEREKFGQTITEANITESEVEGVYRSLIESQLTIVVLDNARSHSQIAPLLSAKACFLISSRKEIIELQKVIRLSAMSPKDAETLLFKITPKEKFVDKAGELAKLAGYLPMALKPLANLLKRKFAKIDDILRDYKTKILELVDADHENMSVEASFELSYDALTEKEKEYWRSLAVFPSDFEANGASTVFGTEFDEGFDTLTQFYEYSLIEEDAKSTDEQPRFKIHDIARIFCDKKLSSNERSNRQLRFAFYYSLILREAERTKLDDRKNGFINALILIDTEWSNIEVGQEWTAKHFDKSNEIAGLCRDYSGAFRQITLRLHPRDYILWLNAGLKACQQIGDRQGEGSILGNLGNAYKDLGEYRKAIDFYEQTLQISREIGDREGEGSILSNLGIAYRSLGEYKIAIDYHQQALQISREIGDRQGEGSRLGNLGNAYKDLGEYRKAIDFYEQALQISREIGNRQGEGLILGNLGSAYWRLGEYRKAIDFYEQALQIAEEIGDRQGEGNQLGSLGIAYRSLGEYKIAIEYHQQALQIAEEIGDRQGEGNQLGNLGIVYDIVGEYRKAIDFYEQALQISREIGDREGEGTQLGNLGIAYLNLGEYKKAIDYYEQALQISREIGDRQKEGNWLGNLGSAYLRLGEYKKAIDYYEQALQISREIGDRQNEGNWLGNLGSAYLNLGEKEKACGLWKEALTILEAIESPNANVFRKSLEKNCI